MKICKNPKYQKLSLTICTIILLLFAFVVGFVSHTFVMNDSILPPLRNEIDELKSEIDLLNSENLEVRNENKKLQEDVKFNSNKEPVDVENTTTLAIDKIIYDENNYIDIEITSTDKNQWTILLNCFFDGVDLKNEFLIVSGANFFANSIIDEIDTVITVNSANETKGVYLYVDGNPTNVSSSDYTQFSTGGTDEININELIESNVQESEKISNKAMEMLEPLA